MHKLVLHRPEKPENTGFIARLCANFDAKLVLVKPGFNLSESRKTASRAQNKLNNAEIHESLENSLEDLKHVIGTKPGKGSPVSKLEPRKDSSLLIGPESNGLTTEELELCDTLAHIPTAGYSSLNQSHAAAVMMSHLNPADGKHASKQKMKELERTTGETTMKLLRRASPTPGEADRLIAESKD